MAKESETQALVDRETATWDGQDLEELFSLSHPDMVWPLHSDAEARGSVTWAFQASFGPEREWTQRLHSLESRSDWPIIKNSSGSARTGYSFPEVKVYGHCGHIAADAVSAFWTYASSMVKSRGGPAGRDRCVASFMTLLLFAPLLFADDFFQAARKGTAKQIEAAIKAGAKGQ